MAFLRQSKFRHVFGTASRKDKCYEGFRPTNCAFEGTFIAANKKFIAVCVETGGSGAFIVLPVTEHLSNHSPRLDVNIPKVNGHKEYVLDMAWNPYNDNMLATCSEDGTIKLWEFPDSGVLINMDDNKALLSFDYHEKRCVQVSWHPNASNILLSVSQEPKICVWNLDEGVAEVEILGSSPSNPFYCASWSIKGDKIVTVSKDQMIRIFNARTGELIVENKGHEGRKPQRAVFTFNDKFIFTTGFSKTSERQYAVWDATTLELLGQDEIDTANGCLIPYYDPDTHICYLAAKGDSVIRYYELVEEAPYFYYIETYQTNVAQRALASIPKRSVNVNNTEVFKFYKLCLVKNNGYIEPTSFTVPRKSDLFQDDLYPDTIGEDPACAADEWFEGNDAEPIRVPMSQFFEGKKKEPKAGGLKKGGLKGLKAKKDAKVAKVAVVKPPEEKKEEPAKKEPAKRGKEKVEDDSLNVKPSERFAKKEESKPPPVASGSSSRNSEIDETLVRSLQKEIKALKSSEENLKNQVTDLADKLKDQEKLTEDMKLLCDAVKKNDERIAQLESLVQEESAEED